MNIYLISRADEGGYDQYENAIVVAKNAKDARTIHPSGNNDEWAEGRILQNWVAKKKVIVDLVGVAKKGVERGVLCASYYNG
jgi:hypothetical protein